jgi:hypothetical protein
LKRSQAKIAAARPFVCDGRPYECKAFVIGTNSVSAAAFWDFWNDETGFVGRRWLECYRSTRSKAQDRPISPKRERIDKIVSAAAPVKILETNLYSTPTRSEAGLRKQDKQRSVLDFFL